MLTDHLLCARYCVRLWKGQRLIRSTIWEPLHTASPRRATVSPLSRHCGRPGRDGFIVRKVELRWFENAVMTGRTNGRSLRSRPTARAKALSQRRSGSISEMQIIKHHILKVNPLCASKLVLGHTLFLGDIIVHGSWTDFKNLFSRDLGTQVQQAKKRGCT